MAAGAVVVLAGYIFRALGVAVFGFDTVGGSLALLVVNMLILVGMVTFVIALATWILKMGLKASR
jgi:hypothetical protein